MRISDWSSDVCSSDLEVDDKHVALAVAASAVRAEMARKCDEAGLPLLSVWAKDVIVMDDVEIAEGALVSHYVTFPSNIQVGRCFHANPYRSEARWVGKECVSTCNSWLAP